MTTSDGIGGGERRAGFGQLFDAIKWTIERSISQNFVLHSYAKRLAHVVPWLLPHEKDYFGLKLLIKPGPGMFLDVGANDGVSALSFRSINSEYSIMSIEANKLHVPSLEGVKRKLKNYDYLISAVGDEPGSFTLTTPMYKGIPWSSGAFIDPKQRAVFEANYRPAIVKHLEYDKQTVNVVRIDDLNLSPTVVKIDTEGYDFRVLQGMKETIRRCRPVMMIENNPEVIDAVIAFFDELGYDVFTYDYKANVIKPYTGGRTRNVFFTPRAPVA